MTTTPPTRIGKTTVAACAGSSFAQVRQDDPVMAITPTPRSARRVPGPTARDRVVVGLSRAADEHLDTFADVR